MIYWHKTDSIQELYETCQTLYRRAEQFGKDHAIGSTAIPRDAPSSRILGMLTLHNGALVTPLVFHKYETGQGSNG